MVVDEEEDEDEEAAEAVGSAAEAAASAAAGGGGEVDGAAKQRRTLPEVGDLLRIFWTSDRVWFRCRVLGRLASVVRVDYVVHGWNEETHDLEVVAWEQWAEGGPIDPGEAEYDGEQWLGERDVLAEHARDLRARPIVVVQHVVPDVHLA